MSEHSKSQGDNLYAQVDERLQALDETENAAGWHGQLVGYLVAHVSIGKQVLPAELACGEADAFLQPIVADTRLQLADDTGQLLLIVPNDAAPLTERLAALAEWVQGFLVGLSWAGVTDLKLEDKDASEALQDLVEISQLDAASDNSEAQEEAYTQVYEYVRTVVQLLYLHWHGNVDSKSSGHVSSDDQTLH